MNVVDKRELIKEGLRELMIQVGDNPDREGLLDTPLRVMKSWQEIYSGYSVDIESLFTVFKEDTSDEMIILKNIEMYSMCEHHMMPFYGKAHIAYLPDKKVIGISKLARVLEAYARRLQIQERIAQQVTSALAKHLSPLGAACVIEAKHHCMMCRGVNKQNSEMVTSSLIGVFREDSSARAELFQLLKG